jgi:alkylation response protein AidB-like acyl-CoA dehydrogenase
MSTPLTIVSQEEKMFYDQAFAFARERVLPHVREMDEQQVMREDIVRECFDLGLMGIEIPEEHGGAGSTFFNSIMVIEALARVDAARGVIVGGQNTHVIKALQRWGSDAHKAK